MNSLPSAASAGIYLHIPYCKQACSYCDFYFSTRTETMGQLVEALNLELGLRAGQLSDISLRSIYFGGGTPSLLPAPALESLLVSIRSHYQLSDQAECTLEANPDDVSATRLVEWKSLGINRLSLGIQTFDADTLRLMNRAHTTAQAHEALAAVAGTFENWTADLIFGVPNRSTEILAQDLDTLLAFRPPHLSVYGLTVEPRTLLHHQVQKGEVHIDEDAYAREFVLLHEWLTAAGYEHYELSNYALPGMRARHNSSYWSGSPYLGMGPAAHGFFPPNLRYQNAANLHAYMSAMQNAQLLEEKEELTASQLYLEYLMTRLRTADGVVLEELAAFAEWDAAKAHTLARFVAEGYFSQETANHIKPTLKGWQFLDTLLLSLA